MKPPIKPFIILLLIGSIISPLAAQKRQNTNTKEVYSKAFLGLGFGLDYGGIGIKAEFLPVKYLGVFGGAGYNLVEVGYNFGLSAKVLPGKNFCPFIIGMYGYNAALKVSNVYGGDALRKSYYGVTVGAGAEIKGNRNENKTSIAILIPFRSAEFKNTYDAFESAGYKFSPKILPIAFSIGYNFAIGKK